MFRRHVDDEPEAPAAGSVSTAEAPRPSAERPKGRPTPKRRDAQQARRSLVNAPKDRKEAARQQRGRMRENRARVREGMARGEERFLPARDRGPVRKFCRDWVDSQFALSEYLFPYFIVVFVLLFIPTPATQRLVIAAWFVTIVIVPLDLIQRGFRLRAALRAKFPGESTRGAMAYALMRSTQLRKMRMPKPQVSRGPLVRRK